jgi:lysyl-tRNA synthetase class 2
MTSDLPQRIPALRRRAHIVAAIRQFFDRRDYLAVETPQLCRSPIPEAHIELFETHRGADPTDALWLLPSPEYYLKQLLAAGSGNIYEITHSFRDGEEIGRHHDIEFTMLEYYTVEADSDESLSITCDLLKAVGEPTTPSILSMQEAWRQFVAIDLAATIGSSSGSDAESAATTPVPAPDRTRMVEAIRRRGLSLSVSPTDTWEDLFQRVFLTYVEPELPRDRPVFITDYPAAISTLARTKPETPWADRWELYVSGMEVANCFGEETDPERIAGFFEAQRAEKAAVNHRMHPVDEGYLRSPRLPRCSGVALGVDRLVMHLIGAEDIAQVISFRP